MQEAYEILMQPKGHRIRMKRLHFAISFDRSSDTYCIMVYSAVGMIYLVEHIRTRFRIERARLEDRKGAGGEQGVRIVFMTRLLVERTRLEDISIYGLCL